MTCCGFYDLYARGILLCDGASCWSELDGVGRRVELATFRMHKVPFVVTNNI